MFERSFYNRYVIRLTLEFNPTMNDHANPSADAIASAFPHTVLERIHGTLGRVDIDDAQENQTENAASRPSTRVGGAHGHAGMVVPPGR